MGEVLGMVEDSSPKKGRHARVNGINGVVIFKMSSSPPSHGGTGGSMGKHCAD